jgi:hypothetical protein
MLAPLLAALVIAPPALLPGGSGWHVASATIRSHSCPRCVQKFSRASTVRYLDAPNDFPQKTMPTLGPDDVILQVTRSWEPSPPKWEFMRHSLRIVRAQIHARFEGNPTHGRVSEWITSTWRNGSLVQVYAFFGSPSPTASTVAQAQRELDGTRFAAWTIRN